MKRMNYKKKPNNKIRAIQSLKGSASKRMASKTKKQFIPGVRK